MIMEVVQCEEKKKPDLSQREEKSVQARLLSHHMMVMLKRNTTLDTRFLLLGFQTTERLQHLIFLLGLLIYCVTICGNLLIITLVSYSKSLQSPMYLFLTQLSVSDITLTTDIVPNMLHIVLKRGITISFTRCITQFYFFTSSECLQCLILTVMSYDRYVAICNPLCYISIMTSMLCLHLVIMFWFLSFSLTLVNTVSLGMLQYCGPNVIDHFFCDFFPLLALSCSDTFWVEILGTILSIPVVVFPFGIIIVSYVHIILVILRIPSATGRQKTFSTCSSHLITVSTYYVTLIFIYILPTRGQSTHWSKVISLLYTMGTPLLNPIIYSLRNQDIKNAFKKLFYGILY